MLYRARANIKRLLGDMAGYAADRDQSVKLESSDFPLAWVDEPIPRTPLPEITCRASRIFQQRRWNKEDWDPSVRFRRATGKPAATAEPA